MKIEDVEIIHHILAGDEDAFTQLVERYQKQVHALVWRKIGDFHIAEEITQDTFLKVHQKLSTLKNPNQFSGWLYVIATRECLSWLRKKKIETESLEESENEWIDESAYSQYVIEENAKARVDSQREVVKKLLAKLKDSERTVMTLHYLGEMTVEEISRFLGVSRSAIKLRLHRARQRLQKEETMIREALSNFQLSPNLTGNIMQKIKRTEPAAPSGSKPLVPLVIGTASIALIVLMLGIGSQYLTRLQQPYSLEAQSEMAVELIDVPIAQNFEATPDTRNRLEVGSDGQGNSEGDGQEANQVFSDKENYTQLKLPESANARMGMGKISGNIAFSPDGTKLAVASPNGIWFHDASSGKELDFFASISIDIQENSNELLLRKGHIHEIHCVSFSPNGKLIASGSWDGSIVLWDMATGKQKVVLYTQPISKSAFSTDVRSISFSPNGKKLVSAHRDGTIRLWDVATAKQVSVFTGHHEQYTLNISFSPTDNNLIASGGMDTAGSLDRILLWNIKTGKYRSIHVMPQVLQLIDDGDKILKWPAIFSLCFSPDGKTIATGHRDNTVRLWDVTTGTNKAILKGHTDWIFSLAFSNDGTTLVSGSLDKTVRLWDVLTGKNKVTLNGHTEEVQSIAYSPDGSKFASSTSGEVRLWEATTGLPIVNIKGYSSRLYSTVFSPDGTTIAGGYSDGTVRLWDSKTRKLLRILTGHTDIIRSISFSSDSKRLISGGDDKNLFLWDVSTGKQLNSFIGHTEKITSVTLNTNGQILASASESEIWLWDVFSGQHKSTLDGHTGVVSTVLFSLDGRKLASGSKKDSVFASDCQVLIWDVLTGKQIARMNVLHGINDLSFNSDGRMLACAGRNRTIYLWDLVSKNIDTLIVEQPLFKIHPELGKSYTTPNVLSVSFSSNGKMIGTGHSDNTVRVWDVSTQQQKALFVGHLRGVGSVSFSSDNKTLASGGGDGTILLWDLNSITGINPPPQ